jgi:hypothetical protein
MEEGEGLMHSRVRNADAQLAALPLSDEVLVPIGTGGGGGSTTGDTLTANDTINLGGKARLVALANGLAIDVLDGNGDWVREVEWSE